MSLVKIKMLFEQRGSQDGAVVETFRAGETYDVCAALAGVFIDELKVAEPATLIGKASAAIDGAVEAIVGKKGGKKGAAAEAA